MTAACATEPQNDADEAVMARQLELLATAAERGCGLSHDRYVRRYSAAVDAVVATLSRDARMRAILLARQWDYATPQEQAEQDAGEGRRSPAIECGCCPADGGTPCANLAATGPNVHSFRVTRGGMNDLDERADPGRQCGVVSGEGTGAASAAPRAPMAAAAALCLARDILLTSVSQLVVSLYGNITRTRLGRRGA